jgi:hypothetical protein
MRIYPIFRAGRAGIAAVKERNRQDASGEQAHAFDDIGHLQHG